jgi:hypothetical protein
VLDYFPDFELNEALIPFLGQLNKEQNAGTEANFLAFKFKGLRIFTPQPPLFYVFDF